MTDARTTQVTAEQWSQPSPNAQSTQVAIEQWGLTGSVSTRAVATQVALEQWANITARAPIELAGNLGGISSYGKSSYGVKHYSRVDAFAPLLAADLTVFSHDFSGVLTPIVTFAADLIRIGFVDFVSDLAPQIAFGGSLAVDVSFTVLEGGLTPIVSLGASSMISGPLWAASELCPSTPWMETGPCPPPAWVLSDPCPPIVWAPTRLCYG